MAEKRIIVAIDGPAGAGKSSVARRVAERLGFVYIDTGAMYRSVALEALREGIGLDDEMSLEDIASQVKIEFEPGSQAVKVNGEEVGQAIRAPAVGEAASRVSMLPGVRKALVEQQRAIGARRSVVMEGRDIATVVFPDADVKIFLDADAGIRSRRRAAELRDQGAQIDAGALEREMADRDHRDRTRAESPLMQAPDAVYLDTTSLTLDEVVQAVLRIVRERTSNGKEARH